MIEEIQNVAIRGISAAVPKRSVEVTECRLEGNWERFSRMTGIERRRIAPPEMFTLDLAEAAARALLDDLAWSPSSIDILTFVTQTPDMAVPAMACLLQHRLGLSRHVAAKDVGLGCSGYPYGLVDVGRHLSAPRKRALLIVGETTGKAKEFTYAPMFGDAVSATALEAATYHDLLAELMTDGSRWDAISERSVKGNPPAEMTVVDGEPKLETHYTLKGPDIMKFALTEVPPAIERMSLEAGVARADLDAVIFHQANDAINAKLRQRCGLSPEQTPGTLADFGNTSSATIPLTMVVKCGQRLRERSSRMILCGFGVGLSWGTVFTRVGPIACPSLIEI